MDLIQGEEKEEVDSTSEEEIAVNKDIAFEAKEKEDTIIGKQSSFGEQDKDLQVIDQDEETDVREDTEEEVSEDSNLQADKVNEEQEDPQAGVDDEDQDNVEFTYAKPRCHSKRMIKDFQKNFQIYATLEKQSGQFKCLDLHSGYNFTYPDNCKGDLFFFASGFKFSGTLTRAMKISFRYARSRDGRLIAAEVEESSL